MVISVNIEKARFWLRSILTYAKVVDIDGSCGFRLPPIIFVVTHKDKIPGQVRGTFIEAYGYLCFSTFN